VAELNDDYISQMEDVSETYERPYDPQEPVVCLDEKPVTLHADVRPASPAQPGPEWPGVSGVGSQNTPNAMPSKRRP